MPNNNRRRNRKKRARKTSASSNNVALRAVAPAAMHAVPGAWNPIVMDAMPMVPPRRQPICTLRRTYRATTLSANTGDTLYALNFALNLTPNYAEFTNLYDQYRILEAVVTFAPYVTVVSNPASAFPGFIGTWIDYNDSNLPANIQEGQQYDTFQRNVAATSFVRVIRPRTAVGTYSGSAFTGYTSKYGDWIDSNSPSVQYYGLKMCITGSTYSTTTPVYEIEVTATIQLRSQH